MRAGTLDRRASFRSETRVSDGMGGATRTWATQFTEPARLFNPSGREIRESGRLEGSNVSTLLVRKSSRTSTVTTAWSVLIDSVEYQIKAINEMPRTADAIEFTIEKGVGV